MDISYAQRLEDYHLAHAFAGEGPGTYVDVGAGHPVGDNVSFWFYLRGWRGLAIEPQRRFADLYPAIRPRDAVACTLVGRQNGEADFHVFEGRHGFSTTVGDVASTVDEAASTVRRPVTTLGALCGAHGIERIDVLKVDVEGAEADVLAGHDWQRLRPRLVVVEAVAPVTMAPAWEAWEPVLLARGYRMGLFDGLNRFYVAEEERGLARNLPSEPAPWGVVRHLYEFGRAPDNPDHPDHALARRLVAALLAGLPKLGPDAIPALLSERGGLADAADRDPDAVRAALGRIAAPYDGGLDLEE